jgi:hypothetical protein
MSWSALRGTSFGIGREKSARRLIVAGFIAFAGCMAHAADSGYPVKTLTGKQVVEKLLDGKDTLAEERESGLAYHYVAGIKDGTQGTLWCFTGNLKPDELTYEIMHDLRRKHSASTLQGNAGPLIVEELRLRYPCKSSQRARP